MATVYLRLRLLARRYSDYKGDVVDPITAPKNVEAVGCAHTALLASHGVLVVADSIERAYLRASAIEWRSRLAWRVETLGAGRGKPMPPEQAAGLAETIDMVGGRPCVFEWAVRRELHHDPLVIA